MRGRDMDMQVRLAAFGYLAELVGIYGEVLPAGVLRKGFEFRGQFVPLKGIQGIFKPAVLQELPLSITTAPPDPHRPAPYDDGFTPDGSVLLYRYRGINPQHHENVGLRRGGPTRVHHRHDPPAAAPAVISRAGAEGLPGALRPLPPPPSAATRRGAHHPGRRSTWVPVVPNGLALCKLHHAAFDKHFIGIRPDLVVQVRRDILDEEDGPMLIHGRQEFHERRILVPRRAEERPRSDLLEERYRRFLSALPAGA
jgi:putative restriction endonuclease